MYSYNDFDKNFVRQRVNEFRGQVQRRIDGVLTEEEFLPLRLQNGLYMQIHSYMLRVAIPYGTLNSKKMRQLALISEKYDKGYGHFTTRQNIQYNWIKLSEVADVLADLAEVDMHAIQTSGNCIRNVTSDHFAGAAVDEIEDPRPVAELLRQWSTGHPEYAFLPRKFKIAVTGSPHDRAAIAFHDIGLCAVRNDDGEIGYKIYIGGGLGRMPRIGRVLSEFIPKTQLLNYVDSIIHVYNRFGRRDNKHRARIKILIDELGLNEARRQIYEHYNSLKNESRLPSTDIIKFLMDEFSPPDFSTAKEHDLEKDFIRSLSLKNWAETNLTSHRDPNHVIVSVSLKKPGATPGDATAKQMRVLADLAQQYAYDELCVSHEQNIILPHVPKEHVVKIYNKLDEADLATSNIGMVSDIISCPGMDYCKLATARSIPIAKQIATRFCELKTERDIGPLKIKISGCINACGHHHVGHIGILGLDRRGVENYQITLGGDGTEDAHIGKRTGPGFSADKLMEAIETIINVYLNDRKDRNETFLNFYRRVGLSPFKLAIYGLPGTAYF
ncbi:MAG: nitrite/sulfite reductase [Pelagibacteraceae bacterium]|jgi:sulfite reductase (NADPH) hemoprotein beta-component|nr:nitrite/sulfite reductase [Pelagibacteraceae bacterium]MBO6483453.1 nitrite/sulfite reductase [Pelagibacteraceae bacterium]MBO6488514.1 nitrite/sulfite reductase [Pelagibacteraceae bacterium]